ncbi:BrnT family toxin [Thiocapsa sp.]|uniref:BrnT family toxin n=1 Tax=Thiocapsa sp. TaxID=2024551 RepID=UPI00359376BE
MKIDWEAKTAASNIRKHGVSFEEARAVFGDPMALIVDDPNHLAGKLRFLILAITRTDNFVIVFYTEREGSLESLAAAR